MENLPIFEYTYISDRDRITDQLCEFCATGFPVHGHPRGPSMRHTFIISGGFVIHLRCLVDLSMVVGSDNTVLQDSEFKRARHRLLIRAIGPEIQESDLITIESDMRYCMMAGEDLSRRFNIGPVYTQPSINSSDADSRRTTQTTLSQRAGQNIKIVTKTIEQAFNNPNLLRIGGAVAGAVTAPVAAPAVLGALGFGAAGVGAGTLAAAIQSTLGGNIVAGSVFAVCQSIGAGGALSLAGYLGSAAVGGGVAEAARRKRQPMQQNL